GPQQSARLLDNIAKTAAMFVTDKTGREHILEIRWPKPPLASAFQRTGLASDKLQFVVAAGIRRDGDSDKLKFVGHFERRADEQKEFRQSRISRRAGRDGRRSWP